MMAVGGTVAGLAWIIPQSPSSPLLRQDRWLLCCVAGRVLEGTSDHKACLLAVDTRCWWGGGGVVLEGGAGGVNKVLKIVKERISNFQGKKGSHGQMAGLK